LEGLPDADFLRVTFSDAFVPEIGALQDSTVPGTVVKQSFARVDPMEALEFGHFDDIRRTGADSWIAWGVSRVTQIAGFGRWLRATLFAKTNPFQVR
jgi:hypothetical protein